MPTPPLRSSRSAGRAFQEIGGDGEDLRAQPVAGAVNRRRQGHGAAAGDGAEADRDRRSVGERHDHVVGIDRPGVGHDLGEDRLHALALRAGAATTRRSCRTDRCAPSRSRTGRRRCPRRSSRCRGRDSGRRSRAARWRARNAATPPIASSALLQRGRIVAAVVDDRLAVAIGNARRDRASRRRGSCCAGAPRRARGRACAATRSITRSIAKAASGRPAPR